MILKRSLVFFFLLFVGSFFFSPKIFAASITITGSTTQIASSDEYSVAVHVSINVTDGKVYFLRGVFHQSGSTNYCGYTWNGTSWYSGPIGNGNNFLPITIMNNVWDGTLKAKIDPADSGCSTSGQFNFKILRYTGSSSTGNDETVTESTVAVVLPTPTPTLQPSPTYSLTSGSAYPTKIPTSSPTPASKNMSIPTQKSVSLSPQKINTPTEDPTMTKGVLATTASDFSPKKNNPEPSTKVAGIQTTNYIPFIFIGIGSLLLISCGILMFWNANKTKEIVANE